MQRGQAVLVDTNIIIEAVRVGCWRTLTGHFRIETVETCCEEARTGNLRRPGYVEVTEGDLQTRLAVRPVSAKALATLTLQDPESTGLDPGERHLWAHALGRAGDWLACCADRAAVNAAVRLGWKDRLVSLEELANHAGARATLRNLKTQFTFVRLSEWRTAALLERGIE
ncbi:MAG: hypothetical protein KGL31_02705 [candidate division NC10 bacterium]|nr:hypothetical protein [candidate division NC10 bacterium]MDE2320817.1 hypothetical protein [candidate division NC10 bacterium]